MKDETPKQKAIREAWGEYWEQVNKYLNEDGIAKRNKETDFLEGLNEIETIYSSAGFWHDKFRLKKLCGINDNNGWLSVKEHGLPEEGEFFICLENVQQQGVWSLASKTFYNPPRYCSIDKISHYQPVVKPQPPIY